MFDKVTDADAKRVELARNHRSRTAHRRDISIGLAVDPEAQYSREPSAEQEWYLASGTQIGENLHSA